MTAIRNQRIGSGYLQGILADSTARYLPRNALDRLLQNGGWPFRIVHGYGTVPFGFHYLVHPAYDYRTPRADTFSEGQRTTAAIAPERTRRAGASVQHASTNPAPISSPPMPAANGNAHDATERGALLSAPVASTERAASVQSRPMPVHAGVTDAASSSSSPTAQSRSFFLAELSRKLEAHNFSHASPPVEHSSTLPASRAASLAALPREIAAEGPVLVSAAAVVRAEAEPMRHVRAPVLVELKSLQRSAAVERASPPPEAAAPSPQIAAAVHSLRIPDSSADPVLERTAPFAKPIPSIAVTAAVIPQLAGTTAPTQRAQIKREAHKPVQAPVPSSVRAAQERRPKQAARERRAVFHQIVPARRQAIAFLERSQLAHAGLRLYK